MVIKMLNVLRRTDEHSKNFNEEKINVRKYQTEVLTRLKKYARGV